MMTKIVHKLALILAGILLTLFVIEITMRFCGFVFVEAQHLRNIFRLRHRGSYVVLCLGESTTCNQYTRFLGELLNKGVENKYKVIDEGVVATDTNRIMSNLYSQLQEYKPDIVVVMMGVNDDTQYDCAIESLSRYPFLHSMKVFKLFSYLKRNMSFKLKGTPVFVGTKPVTTDKMLMFHNEDLINVSGMEVSAEEYIKKGMYEKALRIYKKIAAPPAYNWHARLRLCDIYSLQKTLSDGEKILKLGWEIPFHDNMTVYGLGEYYLYHNRYNEAADAFRKYIKLAPAGHVTGYTALFRTYFEIGEEDKAINAIMDGMKKYPDEASFYGVLGFGYIQRHQYELADESFRKDEQIALKYFNTMTKKNYNALINEVEKRGIRPICMQYPVRSVEPLKKILSDNANYGDIIFVSNEETFKEALRKCRYDEIFTDQFAGDFGHCTDKGNKMIAENLANAMRADMKDIKIGN
jgi:tetratricopeptide (TPR) repeat protein